MRQAKGRNRTDDYLRAMLEENAIPEPNSGCLFWLGAVLPKGDAKVRAYGKKVPVSRLAWILARGPIPRNICVCHKCDIPSCINIDHLFLGTHQENMADCWQKGRYMRRHKDSGLPYGVVPKRKRWAGKFMCHGKTYYLPTFATIEEAAAAVIAKRGELVAYLRR